MMMRKLVLTMLVLAAARPLQAQSGRDAIRATVSDTIRARFLARTVFESVTADAEPRSFQIVRVPIPDPVKGQDGLRFDIEAEPQFNIIGVRGGALAGRAALTDVLVTVGVPGDARAGKRVAARAVFRTPQNEIEVPIEMRVTPVYRLALVTDAQINDLKIGERFELSATVRNDGNAADTVRLAYELPPGWGSNSRDTLMVMLPHETVIRTVRLVVPKNSGTGSFFLHTNATSRGSAVSALTTLAVGTGSAYAAPPGPVLHTSLGAVAVQNGDAVSVAQLAVSGPLTSSINIDARASTRPVLASANVRGLSRVGAYVSTPHFTAWSSNWRARLGSTIADFNDLTGVNAGGSGASFDLDDQKNLLRFTAARPAAGGVASAGGSILGFEVGRQLTFGKVSASGSRMRTNGVSNQSLSALGFEMVSASVRATQLTGGLAYRDYGLGSGLGIKVGVDHVTRSTRLDLHVVHAPGGSSAFARARDEVVGSFLQNVTPRLDVGATFYRSQDANAAARSIRSRTVGVTPLYRFTDNVSVRADVRSTTYVVDGNPFSFGNTERHLGGGATARYGDITYNSDLSLDRVTRTVGAEGVDGRDTGNRYSWHGSAARALSFGAFGLEAAYEHSAAGTGFVPEQIVISMRADRAQLPVGPRNLFFDAEVGYNRWSGIRSMSTLRAGATFVLPYDMEIAGSLERNPLFYAASGRTPWVFALRLDKSVGLPRIITGRAAGMVFQDYNGDGRRDPDEPGMPNIVVRRGYARATSSHDGSYRFWEQGRGKSIVEPASLPFGWIVNDKSSGDNIALVPTTRVQVVLQPGPAERMRNVDLTPANVMARDSLGRAWVARRTSATEAMFDALPVGAYQIEIDFSALSEPLKIDGPAPRIVVTRETSTTITVPVAGRPLRFRSQ